MWEIAQLSWRSWLMQLHKLHDWRLSSPAELKSVREKNRPDQELNPGQPHDMRGALPLSYPASLLEGSPTPTKLISKHSLRLSPSCCIYNMTWPQIKMQVLICEHSPETSSIQWPNFGISPPHGLKNWTSTKLSLGWAVYSSSSRLLSLPLSGVRIPRWLWRQLCKTQLVLAQNLYSNFTPVSSNHK